MWSNTILMFSADVSKPNALNKDLRLWMKMENNQITSWVVGLSSVGFALFIGKISTQLIELRSSFVWLIVFYGAILLSVLIQKIFSKAYTVFTHQRLLLYNLMSIDIKENPTSFIEDLKVGVFNCHLKFMEFGYLLPSLKSKKIQVENKERTAGILANIGFICSLLFFVMEYSLILTSILKMTK